MNRKIYLDVGGFNGDTLWGFTETDMCEKDSELFIWECNSNCLTTIRTNLEVNKHGINDKCKSVTVVDKAATITDGTVRFYPGGVGGSLRKDKTTMINKDVYEEVDCLDFVKWMKENFDGDDEIYCKINIEGSEYDILEKLIDEGVLGWFNLLWVDFHARKLTNLSQFYEDDLIKRLKHILGDGFMTQQEAEDRGIQRYVRF